MKKILYSILCSALFLSSCDDFMDITPTDSITDDGVWTSANSTMLFISNVYNDLAYPYSNNSNTTANPLYSFQGLGNVMFDNAFTDDMIGLGETSTNKWNLFDFTASSAPFDRWSFCYASIRKTNIALKNLEVSTVLTQADKTRLMGDMYFLRGLFYLELFRFYGGVPLIDKPLDRNLDEIFLPKNTAEETLEFIVSDFQNAADRLPVTVIDTELGRATKGAAIGLKAVAYLHGAGTVDSKYYSKAAETANILISGELAGAYSLFKGGFANLFLEENEHNSEVIFDIQYAYPYRWSGFQTICAPPVPANGGYGWSKGHPTQDLVDAFEMKDGSVFDWNNSGEAANPYANRDERFYGTILYNGEKWKGNTLYTSTNLPTNLSATNNPNGLWNTAKKEATKTGYYIRKHQNESVVCGWDNRGKGIGGGYNLIFLRYAEILLTYAEAENEVNGPSDAVYNAVNSVRNRAGQPNLPTGLKKEDMREKIRHERRVELAFEGKRFFDIIRWNAGEVFLNHPVHGCAVTYKLGLDGKPAPTYKVFEVCEKKFIAPKNNLLPIPQSAIDKNPKLVQNSGW